MSKKTIVKMVVVLLVIGIIVYTIYSASLYKIKPKEFKEALQNYIFSEVNGEEYEVSIKKKNMTVTNDEDSFNVSYNLKGNPTFIYEFNVEKGMNYEDFEKYNDNLILSKLGYIAVAGVNGIKNEDSNAYFLNSYLASAFEQATQEDMFAVIDEKNSRYYEDFDGTIIYTSEFGDKAIDYVKSIYPETLNISDSDLYNTYSLTIERKDINETTCKIVSTLTVNWDSDFSKLNGYMEQQILENMDSDITKENANIVLDLKVGQKCSLVTSEGLNGYEMFGYDCFKFNEDKTELVATGAGVKNGYWYIGEESKSIYITVEENSDNSKLEEIVLNLDEN